MTRQERVTRVFVELADTLVAGFDVIDFLHTLVERSVELLAADAAGLMLANQKGELEVVAASSEEALVLELFELQTSQGPCMDCFLSGEPLMNIDVAQMADRWPLFAPAAAKAGYLSAHAIPLRLRGQIIGAMNLFCADEGPLTQEDVALGQGMADIATIGLLQQRRALEQDILTEQLQAALSTRIVIEQAKGVLAERAGVSVGQAFALMRARARLTEQPLTTIAYAVIDGTLRAGDFRAAAAGADPVTLEDR
jgi:transcriptional regulator with GAF, ATPase, and Fis domain